MEAASLAYSDTGRLLPRADCGRLAIVWELKVVQVFESSHKRKYSVVKKTTNTVQTLCIGTGRFQQTVQTKIRLLLKKQSDQGLRCLPVHQHLLDALMQCYVKRFYF